MSLAKIKNAILLMTRSEQKHLRDFLENILEDRLELTDEFKADIQSGKADIAAGRVRVRKR
jgi:hypothetical protein